MVFATSATDLAGATLLPFGGCVFPCAALPRAAASARVMVASSAAMALRCAVVRCRRLRLAETTNAERIRVVAIELNHERLYPQLRAGAATMDAVEDHALVRLDRRRLAVLGDVRLGCSANSAAVMAGMSWA